MYAMTVSGAIVTQVHHAKQALNHTSDSNRRTKLVEIAR